MPTTNGGANNAVGAVNYATEYGRALSQAFPYALNFGALYATPNNGRFRWVNPIMRSAANNAPVPSSEERKNVPALIFLTVQISKRIPAAANIAAVRFMLSPVS